MKIIILGAHQVGSALAEQLVKEGHDITIVDINAELLRNLESRLDIRTIVGHASHPSILRQAGAETADMLIAVTHSDEVNIMACQVAYTLYRTPKKIARIRSAQYLAYQDDLFSVENIPIDVCISPEQLITQFMARLIDYPGALQVIDFADGKVRMIAIRPHRTSILLGKTLAEINEHILQAEIRVVAIYRHEQSITINGDTKIGLNDEVFFIAQRKHINAALDAFGRSSQPNQKIMIAGGGHIGYCLAQALEGRYQVKLLELDPKRAEFISSDLSNTIVLNADASDKALLVDENIENMDVFCAVTNDDEANIMSCLQSKRLGARQVMALINRPAYVDLIEGSTIDVAISPQQVTIGTILRYLRQGDVTNVYSLRRGAAEAIEVVAHGDERSSRVINHTIADTPLPDGTNIGAIIRGEEVIIAHHDTVIKAGDHVLVFVLDKKRVHDIERLFRSSF